MIVFALLTSLSFAVSAQKSQKEDNDYSNNRGEREGQDDSDIPTNNATPIKNIEKVVGTWEVSAVYKGKKNITGTDTAGLNRSFEFTRTNKYKSYSNNEQIDSGAFKLNEAQDLIYLESANGNEVTEYRISFDDETMTLLPRESSDANSQRFRYVYTRKSE